MNGPSLSSAAPIPESPSRPGSCESRGQGRPELTHPPSAHTSPGRGFAGAQPCSRTDGLAEPPSLPIISSCQSPNLHAATVPAAGPGADRLLLQLSGQHGDPFHALTEMVQGSADRDPSGRSPADELGVPSPGAAAQLDTNVSVQAFAARELPSTRTCDSSASQCADQHPRPAPCSSGWPHAARSAGCHSSRSRTGSFLAGGKSVILLPT